MPRDARSATRFVKMEQHPATAAPNLTQLTLEVMCVRGPSKSVDFLERIRTRHDPGILEWCSQRDSPWYKLPADRTLRYFAMHGSSGSCDQVTSANVKGWSMLCKVHELNNSTGTTLPFSWTYVKKIMVTETDITSSVLQNSYEVHSAIELAFKSPYFKIFDLEGKFSFDVTASKMWSMAQSHSTTTSDEESIKYNLGPYPIKPHSTLYIYDRWLYLPGLGAQPTGIMEVTSYPVDVEQSRKEVIMQVPVKAKLFLSNIVVESFNGHVYKKDYLKLKTGQGADSVDTVYENNGDINKGFEGKFVYLRAEWTRDWFLAADNITLVTDSGRPQWTWDRGMGDMAEGAGGLYRFLDVWKCREGNMMKITDIVLWEGELHCVPDGWNGMTADLNQGRGGRCLYVVWKTARAA